MKLLKPLTKAEINASLPTSFPRLLVSSVYDTSLASAKRLYGRWVVPLTIDLVKVLQFKKVYMIYGKQWAWNGAQTTKKARRLHLAKLKPIRMTGDRLLASVDGYIESFVYFVDNKAVTGRNADPVYVFVR